MSTISASTTSTTAYKVTADTTGTLVLQTGSTPTTAVTIDTSQNMGLGVTPSAWSGVKALEIAAAGSGIYSFGSTDVRVTGNAYWNGSAYKYGATNLASMYVQNAGIHYWYNAASGTAGNSITWTQAMTLDASGRLLVGPTSGTGNYRVDVSNGSNDSYIRTATTGSTAGFLSQNGSNAYFAGVYYTVAGAYQIYDITNSAARLTITSSGYVLTPYQPGFMAYVSNSSATFAGPTTILFNSTNFNTGLNYDGANGRFTAPVAGVYHFCRNQQSYSSSNQEVMFYKNGSQVNDTTACYSVGANGNNSSIYLSLAAGDYVTVYQYSGTSLGDYNNFSGVLVG